MHTILKSFFTAIALFVLSLATPLTPPLLAANPPAPNIVLIFVDDMGYGDLACYGNTKTKTPNIDRLASQGQRWTSFYSSGATCVPSRRGLMSGRHPNLMQGANFLQTRDKLLPAMLNKAGYATAILGKWHIAGYPADFTKAPLHPLNCGFDYHYGTPGSNDVPKPDGHIQNRALFDRTTKFTFQVPLYRGDELIEFPANQELFTQRYTKEAVQWIHDKKDERFFLYLAHNMPHAPVFASKKFKGRSAGGTFGDTIEEIDWSVGQVMKALDDTNNTNNTLVIFTSDNGPWTMFGPHGGTAGPLRGEKGTSWEGGYRVPGIFRWPTQIKPGLVHDMGANLDLYATFATLANAQQPSELKGYISKDLTGVLLRNEPSPRKQWLFNSGSVAFRSGDYKIHLSTKDRSSNPDTRKREAIPQHNPPLLYNLTSDVGEQTNIGPNHPEIIARLLDEMAAFQNQSN